MGTGGSRYGAGRPGWRRKCEHLPALDVRELARRGRLYPGMRFSWAWSGNGESAGEISVQSGSDHLRLIYTWTPHGAEPRSYDYPVRIDRTRCHYGASRPWFVCPRCHSRRAVLFGIASDGRFGCRYCMRLAYACEAESRIDRINRKTRRLEAKLEEDGVKPKWMRWRTYERICARLDDLEGDWGVEAFARFAPLLARHWK